MRAPIGTFLIGFTFALGLGISGMTDANKVIGFLNIAGQWDPTLAFVLMGATGLHFVLFRLILRRQKPLLGDSFQIPTHRVIDVPLVLGAAMFGVGWGLGGFCPGPGVVSAVGMNSAPLLFTASMFIGLMVAPRLASAVQRASGGSR